jgi:tetratricopeptide (TPR) repeat protein
MAQGDIGQMHRSAVLAVAVALAAWGVGHLRPALAQETPTSTPTSTPNWQACISPLSALDARVSACTDVIDAKSETGRRLAAAYCNRGEGLTEKRDLDAGFADLNEAIRIDPVYACSFVNRGRVFALKRDLDRAISDDDEAIRLDPSFALAYNNRGNAYRDSDQLDRAAADYGVVIQIAPRDARGWRNRGLIRLY